ncbi:hypothetical protein B0T26DRAFT_472481 [Lasiosphaeria miniovina]|uniref:Uncharacterized protein n=1 Tax=Lasiosphaeria miniovina TaxID=1954250 RepID=A0AA40A016_9PEZI|nr:uncharacterized protein B0T26DRAFT_472481 [Lasiosphaeria miniovina]KAK0706780.1 hypothetical protein B0T26DRAFT_472481 [Lasiosphaeria miniovina]
MADLELIHAYRHLLRAGLRAVQFSKPGRFVIRDKLRAGFRDPDGILDADRVRRTTWFLNGAAQARQIEHRIVKNIVMVSFARKREANRMAWGLQVKMDAQGQRKPYPPESVTGHEFEAYERTIALLNDSMGLCLR